MQKKEYEKKKVEVVSVVNKVEDIDSKIAELQQEKLSLTSEYHVELLEHDLKTIKYAVDILEGVKTKNAKDLLEYHEVIGIIEDVTSGIEEELKK